MPGASPGGAAGGPNIEVGRPPPARNPLPCLDSHALSPFPTLALWLTAPATFVPPLAGGRLNSSPLASVQDASAGVRSFPSDCCRPRELCGPRAQSDTILVCTPRTSGSVQYSLQTKACRNIKETRRSRVSDESHAPRSPRHDARAEARESAVACVRSPPRCAERTQETDAASTPRHAPPAARPTSV